MSLKTIAVFVDFSKPAEARTRYAVRLALRHGAHLIGIFIARPNESEDNSRAFIRGETAIRDMIDRDRSTEQARLEGAKTAFRSRTSREDIQSEFRVVAAHDAKAESRLHSLHADLIVVGFPSPGGLPRGWSAATMLLATGVPLVIVPDDWNSDSVAERVLLGWNASREARRAMTDSLGLLIAANKVCVLVVDGENNNRHGQEPGLDAALFLERHGVNVGVEQVPSNGRQIAAVIQEFAKSNKADLIVVGAYSHSRSREIMFGGVTQSLLEHVSIPLLIAH